MRLLWINHIVQTKRTTEAQILQRHRFSKLQLVTRGELEVRGPHTPESATAHAIALSSRIGVFPMQKNT